MRGKFKPKAMRRAARRAARDVRDSVIIEARTKYRAAGLFRRLLSAVLGILCLFLMTAPAVAQPIPRAAVRYQRDLIANARVSWGLTAPIATLAAQVHQESGWREDARSAFAGGLAQFTPDTADWISRRFASELGDNQPFNPSWALRALARYDRFLYDGQTPAATECDRWAFTLSAYNGGAGWVAKDRRLTTANGGDPARWWGQVERYSPRAAWAVTENRGYPRRILVVLQPLYIAWGGAVDCRAAHV